MHGDRTLQLRWRCLSLLTTRCAVSAVFAPVRRSWPTQCGFQGYGRSQVLTRRTLRTSRLQWAGSKACLYGTRSCTVFWWWWWCRPHPVREHAQDLRTRSGPAQLLPPHVKQRSHPHGVRPQIPYR